MEDSTLASLLASVGLMGFGVLYHGGKLLFMHLLGGDETTLDPTFTFPDKE